MLALSVVFFVLKGAVAGGNCLAGAQATVALQELDDHFFDDINGAEIHLQNVVNEQPNCPLTTDGGANCCESCTPCSHHDEFVQASSLRVAKQDFAEVSIPVISRSLPREFRPPIS